MLFAVIQFGAEYYLFTAEKHIRNRIDYIRVCKWILSVGVMLLLLKLRVPKTIESNVYANNMYKDCVQR
jgi:hypothetical protein